MCRLDSMGQQSGDQIDNSEAGKVTFSSLNSEHIQNPEFNKLLIPRKQACSDSSECTPFFRKSRCLSSKSTFDTQSPDK
jgi:hypothetical protein